MKKWLLTLGCCLLFSFVWSQGKDPKVDSIAKLLQQYFNQKDGERIYALTGVGFQKSIPPDLFKTISSNNLFPLGEMKEVVFEKAGPGGVHKYKATFTMATLALFLSLDDKDKLSTFLFKEYVDETARKTEAVPSSNAGLTALDKIVASSVKPYMELVPTTGLSIGILKDGQEHYYGYGETARGNRKIPDAHTLFEIGSITKTFTAILLAAAVQEGKISLDDPVRKYLPGTNPLERDGATVTVRMLSNHSSGLPRMPGNFANDTDPQNPYKEYTKQMLLDYFRTAVPERKPGTTYEYSNLAVAALGIILEHIYKKSFEQLVAERITGPLKMHDTRQYLKAADSARFAKGYDEAGKPASQWDFQAFAAAGALRSTAADLLRYAKANLGDAPQLLLKAIQQTHVPGFRDGNNSLGLGWHLITPGRDQLIFHNGGTGGFRSYLAINPAKKLAVVLLSNTAIGTESVGHALMQWLENN